MNYWIRGITAIIERKLPPFEYLKLGLTGFIGGGYGRENRGVLLGRELKLNLLLDSGRNKLFCWWMFL